MPAFGCHPNRSFSRTRRLVVQGGCFKIASKRFDLVNCDAPHDGFNVPI